MEKLFFSITRWLMLIGATIAFVFLIGGAIYAFKLYKTSQDTQVNGSTYNTKEPDVSFDRFKRLHQEELKLKEKQRLKIKKYVLEIIQNGSSGHSFSMGSMPPNMLKGQNAKIVAQYVSRQLYGEKPASFGACAACHGDDGKGMNGMSPNLLKLPIYNGLVPKTTNSTVYAATESKSTVKKYTNPLQQYSSKLAGYINKYAITVGQEGVAVDKMFDFIKGLKNEYDGDSFEILKVQLDDGLKALLSYGEHLKQTKQDTKEAIVWSDFIDWSLKDFNIQIKQENQKYQQSLNKLEQEKNQKLSKATEAQVELLQLLTALGVSLIVFILLTMILVLFKIEANTRKNNEIQES